MVAQLLSLRVVVIVSAALAASAQEAEQYEQPPFHYSTATPRDGADALRKELAEGRLKLGESEKETVRALLRRLDVPEESQLLVFSRTSFQRDRISPRHPRALYFNDNNYVGWVPGGLVEITTMDPILGPMFYSLDPSAARTNGTRALVRDADCLRCHGGTFVRGIPGVFARSVFPDAKGEPITRFGFEVVDFRTPFTNRWGGWYVTGLHGSALHRGNILCDGDSEQSKIDFSKGANRTSLSEFFEGGSYLRGDSDVVALLVFEQQLAVQNTLTRASLDSRRMLEYQKNLQIAFKTPVTDEPAYDSVKSVFDHTAQDVADALLFKDEAELPVGLQGSAGFQKAFLQQARKTSTGDSLKELDLRGHIFRNRCSYLIYSDMFKELPHALRTRIYTRLAQALRDKDPDPRYSYIGQEERKRIRNILSVTQPALFSEMQLAAESTRSPIHSLFPNETLASRQSLLSRLRFVEWVYVDEHGGFQEVRDYQYSAHLPVLRGLAP